MYFIGCSVDSIRPTLCSRPGLKTALIRGVSQVQGLEMGKAGTLSRLGSGLRWPINSPNLSTLVFMVDADNWIVELKKCLSRFSTHQIFLETCFGM
jgi:hypothetical protein